MAKLYDMTGDILALREKLGEDEEFNIAVLDTIEGIQLSFEDKAVGIIKISEELNSDVSALDEAIKRLQERKKSIVNKQNNLKEYLRYNMESSGIKKIECPLFSITLRSGSPQVSIEDESKLPDDYVNVKSEIVPDKKEILKALKEGKEVTGASLVTGKSSLLIK